MKILLYVIKIIKKQYLKKTKYLSQILMFA